MEDLGGQKERRRIIVARGRGKEGSKEMREEGTKEGNNKGSKGKKKEGKVENEKKRKERNQTENIEVVKNAKSTLFERYL